MRVLNLNVIPGGFPVPKIYTISWVNCSFFSARLETLENKTISDNFDNCFLIYHSKGFWVKNISLSGEKATTNLWKIAKISSSSFCAPISHIMSHNIIIYFIITA